MKNLIIALVAGFSSISFTSVNAQSKAQNVTKTDTIEVEGSCNMCKKRIENAAYINGVKRAEWDKNSKKLTVSYNSKKTSLNKIEANIAKEGHDAGAVKATEDQYKKLPNCCAYKHVEAH